MTKNVFFGTNLSIKITKISDCIGFIRLVKTVVFFSSIHSLFLTPILVSLSLPLPLSLSLFSALSLSLSLSLSHSLSLSLPVSVSFCLSVCLSLSLWVYIYIYIYVCVCVCVYWSHLFWWLHRRETDNQPVPLIQFKHRTTYALPPIQSTFYL